MGYWRQKIIDLEEQTKVKLGPSMLKRRKVEGKGGGGGSWDEVAVQMVCELCVIGVAPNAIPTWRLAGGGPGVHLES